MLQRPCRHRVGPPLVGPLALMMEVDMTEHTRRFFILEIPTEPSELRRFSLYDAVADMEFEVRELARPLPADTVRTRNRC